MNESRLRYSILVDFFTNVSVAWFSAGVVSPFFIKLKTPAEILFSLAIGVFNAILFLQFAYFSKKQL